MAPKRSSSAAKKPAAKKAKSEVPKLCSVVVKALDAETGLPGSVVKMLSGAVGSSLALLKEERHQFQEKLVGMIGEALAAKGAALEKALADKEAKLSEANADKEKLAAAVAEAEAESKAKEEAEAQAKEKVGADSAAVKEAVAAEKEAMSKQASEDAAVDSAAASKAELETVQKEHMVPVLEGTAENLKASVKEVLKAAKSFVTDSALLESLPASLSKTKESRGTFDSLVIKQMEEAAAAKLASLEATVSEGTAGKAERAAAVEAAKQAVVAAKETLEASEKVLVEAKAATKDAEPKAKEAKAAAKQAEPNSKKAEKEKTAAATVLDEFKAQALATYEQLKERVPPPPPAEEPAAEAAAEPAAEPTAATA